MTDYEEAVPAVFAISYKVAFRLTGDRSAAEDIAQEVCARAYLRWTRITSYHQAWSAQVAANMGLDELRRRRRPPGPPSAAAARIDDERLDLVAGLRRLPRRQREVIVLRYIADLPEQVVAERRGCSVGAVKQHTHRGLSALRLALAPEHGAVEGV